jgi:uncharacterized protein
LLDFSVADLIQAPFGSTREVGLDDQPSDLGPELILRQPIRGKARIHRTQGGVLVQCEATTTVELECSRCLQPFTKALRARFTELFHSDDIPGGDEEPEDDDEPFRVDEHHVVDLTEPLRQYFTIVLPLAPICRPDCPGLCPVCGALMEGHQCSLGEIDPGNPFAALAKLAPDLAETDQA